MRSTGYTGETLHRDFPLFQVPMADLVCAHLVKGLRSHRNGVIERAQTKHKREWRPNYDLDPALSEDQKSDILDDQIADQELYWDVQAAHWRRRSGPKIQQCFRAFVPLTEQSAFVEFQKAETAYKAALDAIGTTSSFQAWSHDHYAC